MRNAYSPEPLLEVRGLTAGFDAGPVLFGIDLDVGHAELIALVGANGAGKSTLLGALSGLLRATSGTITLAGEDVTRVLGHFPALADKLARDAGTLSGGEQQMVAIGRGLMARPKLLMVDEMSLGLAPKIVDRLIDVVKDIHAAGTALLLVEQDVLVALDVAQRAYVLENGRMVLAGAAADLRDDPNIRKAYLGL